MPKRKDAIFFAYSFDKDPPSWSNKSDLEVAEWFKAILKKKWKVLSGSTQQARPIPEKVADAVDQSKAIVALFTRKHVIDSDANKYVPSPWVLCECAYGLGRHKYTDHIVAGFREAGVDPNSLGMLTASGMEFPEFDRDNLNENRKQFIAYLDDLESRIRVGTSEFELFSQPYAQIDLHKIYLIYRNGYTTVQNINHFLIKDPDKFRNEFNGEIIHRIWNHQQDFPPLDEMLKGNVHERKREPFFHAQLDYFRNRKIDTALEVLEKEHRGRDITFSIRFLNSEGDLLKLKANDVLRYQYAWGLPKVYATHKEDLAAPQGHEIDEKSYCLAEVRANHGLIEHVKLELRFERDACGSDHRQLFDKSPVIQTTSGYGSDPNWKHPRRLKPAKEEPEEYDMWYEIYQTDLTNFNQRARAAWRPSKKG